MPRSEVPRTFLGVGSVYDFLSIYDAPDEKVASKVSLISMSLGAQKAETWTMLPYSDYIKEVHELLGCRK